jgi:acyl-CoA thioester hydrolase
MSESILTGENSIPFWTEFSVRDYECDIQGVVNNANYLHYLEHARHEFLISKRVSFSKLHEEGIDLVVTRVEINYKYPLRSLDKFKIGIIVRREGNIRLVFDQTILRIPDQKIIAEAKVTGVATRNGRPVPPGKLIEQLDVK